METSIHSYRPMRRNTSTLPIFRPYLLCRTTRAVAQRETQEEIKALLLPWHRIVGSGFDLDDIVYYERNFSFQQQAAVRLKLDIVGRRLHQQCSSMVCKCKRSIMPISSQSFRYAVEPLDVNRVAQLQQSYLTSARWASLNNDTFRRTPYYEYFNATLLSEATQVYLY